MPVAAAFLNMETIKNKRNALLLTLTALLAIVVVLVGYGFLYKRFGGIVVVVLYFAPIALCVAEAVFNAWLYLMSNPKIDKIENNT